MNEYFRSKSYTARLKRMGKAKYSAAGLFIRGARKKTWPRVWREAEMKESYDVVIIGGGVAGENAAYMALGMGADVTVLDRNVDTMRALVVRFGPALKTIYSTRLTIEEQVLAADLVIGAVLVPGAEAPKLISKAMVKKMKKGAVLVDIAIDQGGCFETSHATTHADPTYIVNDIVHYCVANMPGAVPRTSTFALNNATLPFILALADKGYRKALLDDEHLLTGLHVHKGEVTYEAVAKDPGYEYRDARDALAS